MKLKQIIISCMMLMLATACEIPQKPIDEDTTLEHTAEQTIHNIPTGDFEVLVIDSCQYIVYKETEGNNRAFGYMAHKGNCNNPIHYRPNLNTTN